MLRVYVAGPYTAATPEAVRANVQAALDAAIAVMRLGFVTYVPHLSHFLEERAVETGGGFAWDRYIADDLVWLRRCDAVLCLGRSRGVDIELSEAAAQGIPVYWSVEALPRLLEVG